MAVLLAAVTATLSGCAFSVHDKNERSWGRLDAAVRECAHYGGVVTITDVGNGSHGATSGFFVLCHDQHVIRVED